MILVDNLRRHSTTMRHKVWCHMVSTLDESELHAFAERIGLRRSWAQLPPRASCAHYDLTPERRARAIALGATAVSSKELVQRNFDRRIASRVGGGG